MATNAVREPASTPPLARLAETFTRLRTWSQRARLDTRLAGGEHSDGDAALCLRAAQLRSVRGRGGVADALERALNVGKARGAIGATIPVHTDAIDAARPALRTLIEALRAPGPVEARGVALARALLTDVASPLYAPAETGALTQAVHRALKALSPTMEIER